MTKQKMNPILHISDIKIKARIVNRNGTSQQKPKPAVIKNTKYQHSLLAQIFLLTDWFIWLLISRFTAVGLLILTIIVGYYYYKLPPTDAMMDERKRGSVTMLNRDENVFAWRGDQFGGIIFADKVPPHLRNAVIATEDKRFYRHFGISPRRILGAMRTNIREGRFILDGHGGSTITQQVAKDAFFTELTPIERKIKELPMAFAMELKFTKNEILSMYLNRPYLGAGSYGFEAASQRYFNKSAWQLNVPEAAMLAGLLKSPSANAPTNNLTRAHNRANLIITLMQQQGYLTAAEADYARNHPAELSYRAKQKAGGYFADWVMETAPHFIIKDSKEDVIIRTTFDPYIQTAAKAALKQVFKAKLKSESNVQDAIVVMSKNGAVRAIVGGRDIGQTGIFNRATQALRQTGSAFKPFVYAAALEFGYRPETLVLDAPITIKVTDSPNWKPKNYTRRYLGEITLTTALAQSINTSTVRVSESIGREKVRVLARNFGITYNLVTGPTVALGTSEATLMQMTGAYAGILNNGRRVKPFAFTQLRLQGDAAPLLGKSNKIMRRVLNEKAAQNLTYMMYQVIIAGTGRRASLGQRQAADKTGTTQGARDAWFIGFTADYVAGVWMGYDDNSKLSAVTGGGLPAEIWHELMKDIHQNLPLKPLNMPHNALDANFAGVDNNIVFTDRKNPKTTVDSDSNDPNATHILRQLLDKLDAANRP